jgi:hypothetical protein
MFSLNGGTPSVAGSSHDTYHSFDYEEMVDEVGSSRNKTKFVDHRHWRFRSDMGSPWSYHSGLTDVVTDTGPSAVSFGFGFYPDYLTFSHDNVLVEYPMSYQAQLNDTIDRFFAQNEVDNVLNLAEAHQLPSAIEGMLNLLKLASTRSALRRRPSGRLLKGLKGFGKDVANGYLAYSFGIAPLLSDMRAMNKKFRRFHDDLKKHNARKTRMEAVTTRVKGKLSTSVTGHLMIGGHQYLPGEIAGGAASPIRIIGVKGYRTQEYSSDAFKALDYALTRFGGTGPASFVWEKIPYSFVVDWFVDLRGIFNHIDNLLTGNRKVIDDAWMSEKWDCFYRARIDHPNAITPASGTTAFESFLEKYTRKSIPATSKVIPSGRFGKRQLSLAAALAYQLVAKR